MVTVKLELNACKFYIRSSNLAEQADCHSNVGVLKIDVIFFNELSIESLLLTLDWSK